ncbi:EcsC family protein [Virgibacillus siamensis]|uniref:EcsC family protein n=1 Tax=Virgibacillus siamensis TaxID=480071 RepID=A0ABN1GP82_9BACI
MANKDKNVNIEKVVDQALKIPGVKVDRDDFLEQKFSKLVTSSQLEEILEFGPYNAGINKSTIDNVAKSVIHKRTVKSTSVSFGAGIPGGLAMAATIPTDIAQFFYHSLILAQELAYMYGHQDLWLDEHLDTEKARNNLILYLGVMFGVAGSSSAIKFISSGASKEVLKRLPQKALTKTFYYPIAKKVAGYIGIKVNKDIFAKGVSKVIPVLGGVVSGSVTYATMKPMGKRLASVLSSSLDITKNELYNEYMDMKEEFPEIIDIDFEEVDEKGEA